MTFEEPAWQWLSEATGLAPDNIFVSRLRGATSSSLYGIKPVRSPDTSRWVLRVIDNLEWLKQEPDLAAHEAAALQEAQKTNLRAPQFIAYECSGHVFGAPAVLMSHLPGEVQLKPHDLRDWIAQLSQQLALLHQHRAPGFGWNYASGLKVEDLRVPTWSRNPKLWERAIEIAQQKPPDEAPVFIHRDFHPVNVLWQNETICGVVDWVNACQGAAGADVAHSRTNLALLFGVEAADEFLRCYENRAVKLENQWYWDVCSILDVALPQPQWYRPWSEFGVEQMSVSVMQQRDETYLQSVLSRF